MAAQLTISAHALARAERRVATVSLLPAHDPDVRSAVARLPYALQEWWQERAGMRQAEGEPRDEAERKALVDVTRGRA